MFYIHSKCTFFGIFGGEIMFVYGRLKTIFMKPSEIPKEKEKEYFCVGDVPEGGIATYNQGYFIPHKTFSEIVSKYNSEIEELKNTLENKEIEYDKLKRKYDKLLDRVS